MKPVKYELAEILTPGGKIYVYHRLDLLKADEPDHWQTITIVRNIPKTPLDKLKWLSNHLFSTGFEVKFRQEYDLLKIPFVFYLKGAVPPEALTQRDPPPNTVINCEW